MSKLKNLKAAAMTTFKKIGTFVAEISKSVAFNFCITVSKALETTKNFALSAIDKATLFVKETMSDEERRNRAKKCLCLCLAVFAVVGSLLGVITSFEKCLEIKSENNVFYVENKTTESDITLAVADMLLGKDTSFLSVELESAIAPKSKVLDLKTAAEQICLSEEKLQYACGMYVDGVLTAVAECEEQFQSNVDELLTLCTQNGATVVGINENVEYVYGYANESDVLSESLVSQKFESNEIALSVLSVATESYDKEIDFETKVTYDSKKIEGYKSTVKKGVKGVEKVTTSVTYLNGQAVSTETISSNVVVEPVSAEVVKGTATSIIENVPAKFSDSKYSSSAEFIWPVEKTPTMYISSYWGDNRGHKGVDITGPKGTPIYAAKSGTVIYSGTHKSYGKYIKIDHGNGIVTLYSHCNSLGVKTGDKVEGGQQIATVGRTGNATGNHLHFEVIKNGTRVNPASYLGIKK